MYNPVDKAFVALLSPRTIGLICNCCEFVRGPKPERYCSLLPNVTIPESFVVVDSTKKSGRALRSISLERDSFLQSISKPNSNVSPSHHSSKEAQIFFNHDLLSTSPGNRHFWISSSVMPCHISSGNHPMYARSPNPPNQYTSRTTNRTQWLSWISFPGIQITLSGWYFLKHDSMPSPAQPPASVSALDSSCRYPVRAKRGSAAGVCGHGYLDEGGCQRSDSVMLLPAATFLKLEAMVTARIVGLPLAGSQSPKYSISPNGRPATSLGRFSSGSAGDDVLFGKVVERVPSDSRRSIRRAIIADS